MLISLALNKSFSLIYIYTYFFGEINWCLVLGLSCEDRIALLLSFLFLCCTYFCFLLVSCFLFVIFFYHTLFLFLWACILFLAVVWSFLRNIPARPAVLLFHLLDKFKTQSWIFVHMIIRLCVADSIYLLPDSLSPDALRTVFLKNDCLIGTLPELGFIL